MWRRRRPKRTRRGYQRPSRAKERSGWTLRELAELTQVSPRTIREYVQRGLVPRPPFKGPATRYQRRQLLVLLAARRLITTKKLTLAATRARLQALSPDALEAYATKHLAAGPLATALGVQPKKVEEPRAAMKIGAHVPRWAHIELALGLELHIRDDASENVMELCRRLYELAQQAKTAAR